MSDCSLKIQGGKRLRASLIFESNSTICKSECSIFLSLDGGLVIIRKVSSKLLSGISPENDLQAKVALLSVAIL
jgi:hypothetical protein